MSLRYQMRRGLFALPMLALLLAAGFHAPIPRPSLAAQVQARADADADVVVLLKIGKKSRVPGVDVAG